MRRVRAAILPIDRVFDCLFEAVAVDPDIEWLAINTPKSAEQKRDLKPRLPAARASVSASS
jgi:hypothetical protein